MKSNIIRIILFLTLIFTGLSGPVWLFATVLALYIFKFMGIEVIFLAMAIDAYFGYASGGLFIYTIVTSIGLFLVQYLKPHLSMYNQ